ncbi:MAG: AAA family ATPase, partial [Aquificaceae bacterium]|nr:AAA family ATPase [Aquificaceae bacterium]
HPLYEKTHVSIAVWDKSIVRDILSVLGDSLRESGFFTNDASKLPSNVVAALDYRKEPYYYLLISTDDSKRDKTIERIIEMLNKTIEVAENIRKNKEKPSDSSEIQRDKELKKLIVSSIKAKNYRNLEFVQDIKLSINTIVVGENDSGKTSLLRLIHLAVKLLSEFAANAEEFPLVINFNDELGAIYEKSTVEGFIQAVFDRGVLRSHYDRIEARERVRLWLNFSLEDTEEQVGIQFEIAYIGRNLRIIIPESDKNSIQNIKNYRELLKNMKSIYIDNHVIPREEDINISGESLKKYLFRMLNIKNYSDICRVIANAFDESELESMLQFDEIFDNFELYKIKPQPEDWKIKLLLYYSDLDWRSDIRDAKDEKSLFECVKMHNLEEYYEDFKDRRKEFKDFNEFKENLIEHIDTELKRVGMNFDISEVGQGLKDFIFLILLINFLRKENFSSILLLDEPFLHMHPKIKSKAMEYIRRFCRECGIQLIYATHEPRLIPSSEEEGVSYVLLEKITKNRKVHKRYEARNEYEVEKIFSFLKTLGYIEVIQRHESYNHVFLVEGQDDINTYRKLFGLEEKSDILAFKIFSRENISIIPMFIGAILYPKHEEIGSYEKFKDFMKGLKISILLDGDYLSADSDTYKAYQAVLREVVKSFFSLVGIEDNELKLNIAVLPVYSQENILLYLVKDTLSFNEEGIRNHINNKESKIKLNIRNDLSRLKTLVEKLRVLDENQDIRNYRRKHDEEGINGFTNKIFERVRNEPLKYFSGKEIFKLMNIKTEELIDEITKRFKSEYVMDQIGQKFPPLKNFLRQLTG